MWKGLSEGTICAIATGSGIGGIAVVRMSGPDSRKIAIACCKGFPVDAESHKSYYCSVYDPSFPKEPVDTGLVVYFAQGKSFTGEETVEISCHGGSVVPKMVLEVLIGQGARLANPGEFTARAFINQKLDLTQAEGVLNLIESNSEVAARVAARQLRGGLSQKLMSIEELILRILSHLEAQIDYSEQGLQVASSEEMQGWADEVLCGISQLMRTYQGGEYLRRGFQVAIVGQPNVGKSSLLNRLAEEELAIVTDQPGTTRDFVEAKVLHDGIFIHFIDTAGLRSSEDKVEKIGIERAVAKMSTVDLVLVVTDGDHSSSAEMEMLIPKNVSKISVRSKADLVGPGLRSSSGEIWTSAKTGEGIDQIFREVVGRARARIEEISEVAIRSRHLDCLRRAEIAMRAAMTGIQQELSPEFVALELRSALDAVFEVTGKKCDEEVLDKVFSEFCLGK